jgi:cAMP-dependent protein kinase regulator
MYIIIAGKVEVLGIADNQDEEAAATKHICFLERGSCVGELEFLNQHPAVANCVAHTEVRACMLHRDHFELCMGPIMDVLRKTVRQDKYQYYNKHLEDFDASAENDNKAAAAAAARGGRHGRVRGNAVSAEVVDAAADAEYDPPVIAKQPQQLEQLSVTVKRCPLFSALNAQERAVVIGALEPVTIPAGTKIFTEGTVPEDPYWYIIHDGTVQQTKDNGEVVVCDLKAGHSFGEMELMYSTPAHATTAVCGGEPLVAFRLDRRSYRKLVMAVCQERRRLYRELLSGVPFAAALSEQQSVGLADALTPIKFPPGEVMIKFGDHNEWMYIIVDGVVEVFQQNMKDKVCDLRRGEMVGELEFLNKHATVANCVAKTHVQALKLHRDHFEAAMGPCAGFMKEVLKQPKYAYYNAQVKK